MHELIAHSLVVQLSCVGGGSHARFRRLSVFANLRPHPLCPHTQRRRSDRHPSIFPLAAARAVLLRPPHSLCTTPLPLWVDPRPQRLTRPGPRRRTHSRAGEVGLLREL